MFPSFALRVKPHAARGYFLSTLSSIVVGALGACDTAPAQPSHEIDPEVEEQLSALGYTEQVPADDTTKKGVTKHIQHKASPGLNLLYPIYDDTAPKVPVALLMDMEGKEVHRWAIADQKRRAGEFLARLLPNGDLVVLSAENKHIGRYTWESKRIWSTTLPCHHDFNFGPDGLIYTLNQYKETITYKEDTLPILLNDIVVLSPTGEVVRTIPLKDAFWKYVLDETLQNLKRLRRKRPRNGLTRNHIHKLRDVFHTNSVQYITRDVPGMCPKDSLLISLRNLNRIACIDLQGKELWSWGADLLQRQHHPTLLPTDTILVFDNGTKTRRFSQVLELDPAHNMRMVWRYKADDFFTNIRGSAQKLNNGNVLIAESNDGRAFEVTTSGEVVWEFYTDVVEKQRPALYRFHRYSPDYLKRRLPFKQPTPNPTKPPPDLNLR